MIGALKLDLSYLDKLDLVEKRSFILTKSIHTSLKNNYGFQNNKQPNKTFKSVTDFSLNNADFPALAPLSPCKPISDYISVSFYKSVHNSFMKSVHKPSYASSIKYVFVVVYKCFAYNFSPFARNGCVHVSVNNLICKASVTHFSECAANVHHKVFKVLFYQAFLLTQFLFHLLLL